MKSHRDVFLGTILTVLLSTLLIFGMPSLLEAYAADDGSGEGTALAESVATDGASEEGTAEAEDDEALDASSSADDAADAEAAGSEDADGLSTSDDAATDDVGSGAASGASTGDAVDAEEGEEDEEDEEDEEVSGLSLETLSTDIASSGSSSTGVSLSWSAHVQTYGTTTGTTDDATDVTTLGTTGSSKRLEAIKLSIDSEISGSITYRAHVQTYGWQDWVSDGELAGTTGKSKSIQAVQIKLTGDLADEYDIYYRVHSQTYGWLDWAKNGETAGTTGLSKRAEAIQIVLVEKGGSAPGSTDNPCIAYSTTFSQVDETTTVKMGVTYADALLENDVATKVRVTATMTYDGTITREVSKTFDLSSFSDGALSKIDLTTYGPFTVKVEFIKSGSTVKTASYEVGVSASEYNLAPLSASFPVTLYSLAYWDICYDEDGDLIPSIMMLSRPSAYDWDALLDGMYAMPYLTESAIQTSYSWDAYADYVADLYELNPDAQFNLYVNDMTCTLIHQMIYANGIPEGQYSIVLLSDGSGTYLRTNEAYEGSDPEAAHEELVESWNEAKAYAYETGEVADGYGYHEHWDSMYVVLTCEPGTQWWMARTNLFTSGDDNVFADKIANDENVIKKSVSDMLTALEERGDEYVAAFKALYNFNDSYFSDAEEQGKDVMILLGTYVYNEENFEDYANLTMTYYGDDYLYYYKGHPNTPTDLYPEKQEQLEGLGITDIDSSVAAELILFFNPGVSMSGYSSSTFNSATDEMSGGLFAKTKAEALSSSSTVDYSVMDWFASLIDDDTDEAIADLCADETGNCYLMEFSDEILETVDYEFAIYSASSGTITYYTTASDGSYEAVRVQAGSFGVNGTAHVQSYGWLDTVSSGVTIGTTGESKRLEAIKLELQNAPYDGSITYRVHVQSYGWQDWVDEGETAGTTGKSKSIQAVQIELTGELAEYYDVYYRVHSQTYGWLDWACNGEVAGTTGLSKRAEAIQVVVVEKGEDPPGDTDEPSVLNNVTYKAHVQTYGWTSWSDSGETAGTTGESKRLEAVQIKLTGEMAEHYDVYYRVHVQGYGWLDWACNGETAGTTGLSRRVEAIQIVLVEKGGEAPGDTDTPSISG